MRYDNFDDNLILGLNEFATQRGIKTNLDIAEILDEQLLQYDSNDMQLLNQTKELENQDEITIFISTIINQEEAINEIVNNTDFKNYKLIHQDINYSQYYNWYDYFENTNTYSNVYTFYK